MDNLKIDRNGFWNRISKELESAVSSQTYATWFEPLRAVNIEEETVTVEVPSRFYYEWIDSHYGSLIQEKIKSVHGLDMQIRYTVVVGEMDGKTLNKVKKIKKTEENAEEKQYDRGSKLNKRYTFDSFIEGGSNQLAKAAARAVADSPGQTSFNPLLVYGGVGLGKTHLLQAIGNCVIKNRSECRAHYTTSEKFTLDFISAIQNNRTSIFSKRHRNLDLLLVDDIQFLQKKEQTQEQFFHTFNELYQQGRQIVLTTDRHPRELYGLKDRLVSRFQSGLIVDIHEPDLETRIAILQSKAERDRLDIPSEILEFIATNIRGNIREMEGALIKLLAFSSLSHSDVTMSLAQRALRETLGSTGLYRITIDDIISGVSRMTKVSEKQLTGRGRKMEVALARQMAMYLCREMVGASLENVGLHFGGRDHTTVIHACRTIKSKMEKDQAFAEQVKGLQAQMGG